MPGTVRRQSPAASPQTTRAARITVTTVTGAASSAASAMARVWSRSDPPWITLRSAG